MRYSFDESNNFNYQPNQNPITNPSNLINHNNNNINHINSPIYNSNNNYNNNVNLLNLKHLNDNFEIKLESNNIEEESENNDLINRKNSYNEKQQFFQINKITSNPSSNMSSPRHPTFSYYENSPKHPINRESPKHLLSFPSLMESPNHPLRESPNLILRESPSNRHPTLSDL